MPEVKLFYDYNQIDWRKCKPRGIRFTCLHYSNKPIFQHVCTSLQTPTVRTPSCHLVDKLDCGLCKTGWACNNRGRHVFLSLHRDDNNLSAAGWRSYPQVRCSCLAACQTPLHSQWCRWCSGFCVSLCLQHRFLLVKMYLRALIFLGHVRCSIYLEILVMAFNGENIESVPLIKSVSDRYIWYKTCS